MNNQILNSKAGRFYWKVTEYPKILLFIGFLIILSTAIFIPTIVRDTTVDAFIPNEDSVKVYREKVKDIFGLKDPMVIAVINETEKGVFNPKSLKLVYDLTERIKKIEGIDPEKVKSLSTENNIVGTEEGMEINPFFENPLVTQKESDEIRNAVMNFKLFKGSLVSRNGKGTLIVAELLSEYDIRADEVYQELLSLINKMEVGDNKLFVAGEGAVSGFLASYIDSDAQRLNPLAALIITFILLFAFRTLRGIILPNLMVLAAVVTALGTMAAFGVSFYVITNALPILLITIAVADGLHILSEYYEMVVKFPNESQRKIVVRTMLKMYRPVTITSITTISGFIAISISSYMPPMKYFGVFAAIGVMSAMFFALVIIPAGLVLLKPRKSPLIKEQNKSGETQSDFFGQFMSFLGRFVISKPTTVLAIGVGVIIIGIIGITKLEINEDRIKNFQNGEPIVLADHAINENFDGTTYFDIIVETDDYEGLYNPAYLNKIEKLQKYFETLPHVKGSTSIADFIKQMHKAMNADSQEAYHIPDDPDLIAQYFLLYTASADPTDFEEYIDTEYRLANVRIMMNSGLFSDEEYVKKLGEKYILENFNETGLKARMSGRASIDYQTIFQLGKNHFIGVFFSLLAVLLLSMISFRSIVAGLLATVPVSVSILLIYAVMGFLNIYLGLGTSMFAAIAIGVGVDFAVHVIDRFILFVREEKRSLKESFALLYPTTGRALFFNFIAFLLGFGVLITSSVPPLVRFGFLIGVSVSASFLASMTILPALIYFIKPTFLMGRYTYKKVVLSGSVQEELVKISVKK